MSLIQCIWNYWIIFDHIFVEGFSFQVIKDHYIKLQNYLNLTKAWCSQKILHWFYNNLIELQPNCFSQLVTFKPRHFDIKWFYSHKIDKNRSTCSLLHDMNNKQNFSFNNVTVIWLWYHYTENAEIGLIQAIIDICTWHMRSSSTAWW